MILVLQAHPFPERSRANRALGQAIEALPGVEIRSLHDLYPDYAIDVEAEQRALSACSIVVWQHPLYWYTAPALLKHWFEQVLTFGWAHGPGGHALQGKRCLWITTTGADAESYTPAGVSAHEFEAFVPVVRQTARFCGMTWLEPMIVHGVHAMGPAELEAAGARYRARLEALLAEGAPAGEEDHGARADGARPA